MLPGVASPATLDGLSGRIASVLGAWRRITLRQWLLTTAVGLLLFFAHVVGTLPAVLALTGPRGPGWLPAKSIGLALVYVMFACCFLLAVVAVEDGSGGRAPPLRRYVAAAAVACIVGIVLQIALYTAAPALGLQPREAPPLLHDPRGLLFGIVWSAANFGLCGGLALACYVRFRSARLAREAFNAAELERLGASREVLASRLAAMQAQIEPHFLLGTLNDVDALYDRDPQAGARMLDALIEYLRAALPQLRGERSTLERERTLVDSYLGIVALKMESRLLYSIDIGREHAAREFPPMVLLPLIDDALRHGLDPLPQGGWRLDVRASAVGDRLCVSVTDNGLPREARSDAGSILITLDDRLRGLYGDAARLVFAPNSPHGVVATIEVPLAHARHPR